VEYYEYAKRYDESAVIYYLTLDRHEPSTDSKGYLKPGEGEPLQLISFADEIAIWLQDCLEKNEIRQNRVLQPVLEQFLDVINLMTGRNREEIAMQIKNLIVDKDTFRAANAISAELPTIKAKMMKKVFADIKEELREAKKIKPIYADYNKKACDYYEQKGSNWPSLNYSLNKEKTLVLRIEIDHCLYYGYVIGMSQTIAICINQMQIRKSNRWLRARFLHIQVRNPMFFISGSIFRKKR
jgi:hypothetical protein